ncbi:hypothetical protein LOD99_15730 [Oopsacas minuta]|uniref:Uncharacterized protein n=1 Tax=Oopsacas minuta TaxID=111878 RepID=A0AAV7KBD7_9METZ|nr:hypothetical protein LOD99_15730 [Oopsacas minuta]
MFAATNAQFPDLSPSFYMQGTAVDTTTDGTVITSPRFDIAIDATRELAYINSDFIFNGTTFNAFSITSESDNATYSTLTGQNCTMTDGASMTGQSPIPLTSNFWDTFENATEAPPGTFTVANPPITLSVVIVNGRPTVFTIAVADTGFGGIVTVITISNYLNGQPPFSLFTLPESCSEFTCDACYSSSAAGLASSLLMMLAAIALFILSTV